MPRFSERHGLEVAPPPISSREAASENLREMVINLSEKHGLSPSKIRFELCNILFVSPDLNNWSEYPNIDNKCRFLISSCAWHEVFDLIEEISKTIDPHVYNTDALDLFSKDVNKLFMKEGAGWQLVGKEVVARGSEPFNLMTSEAANVLEKNKAYTAASEIHEALKDISRRPDPDKTGAIHHAMGAVECVVRSLSNESRLTLGEIIKSKKTNHGIPAPLDEAISKMWGYASERARHIRERNEPSFEEAELVVTVSAAICIYLTKKII